jgi:hypothetical protein
LLCGSNFIGEEERLLVAGCWLLVAGCWLIQAYNVFMQGHNTESPEKGKGYGIIYGNLMLINYYPQLHWYERRLLG